MKGKRYQENFWPNHRLWKRREMEHLSFHTHKKKSKNQPSSKPENKRKLIYCSTVESLLAQLGRWNPFISLPTDQQQLHCFAGFGQCNLLFCH